MSALTEEQVSQYKALLEEGQFSNYSDKNSGSLVNIREYFLQWSKDHPKINLIDLLRIVSAIEINDVILFDKPSHFLNACELLLHSIDINIANFDIVFNETSQQPNKSIYFGLLQCIKDSQLPILELTWTTLFEHLSEIEFFMTSYQSDRFVEEITMVVQAQIVHKHWLVEHPALEDHLYYLKKYSPLSDTIKEKEAETQTCQVLINSSDDEEMTQLEPPKSPPKVKIAHRAEKLLMKYGKRSRNTGTSVTNTTTKAHSSAGLNTIPKRTHTFTSSMTADLQTPPADVQYSLGSLLSVGVGEVEQLQSTPPMIGMRPQSIYVFGQENEGDIIYTWPTTEAEHFVKVEIYDAKKMAQLEEKRQWTSRIRQYNFAMSPNTKSLNVQLTKVLQLIQKKADPKKNPQVIVTKKPRRYFNFSGTI